MPAISSGASTTTPCRRRARIIAVQPRGDRHVRFVAIDEVDAYYRLATSDLTAPFPHLVSRIPRVVDVAFAARRTSVGRGVMVELEATLTVAGDWRGATVRAGPSFDALAVVARLVDGATVARRPALPHHLDAGDRPRAGPAHRLRRGRGDRWHPRL